MAEKVNNEDFDWFGPDAATFGDRVVGARENSNMTQGQLSRRLGIKLATLQAWEEDRSEPRANKLQMLSGMLNVSLPWLCLLYTSPSPRDVEESRMPSSA